MASIVLSTVAGSALGGIGLSIGGTTLVAIAGRAVGSAVGGAIDNAMFGDKTKGRHRQGARLEELSVQTSTYGKMIPIVYGNARIAGNVIWSRPIKEVSTTTTSTQGGNRYDESNYIDVVVLGDGELSSVAESAMLNGANLALVGEELIQFQTATLLSANKYRLSRLLRGRQGSEAAMATHSAGERFVVMNGAIQKEAMPSGLFGLSRLYKTVSVGKTLGSVSAKSYSYQARALKPLAPVHASGERDGSGNLMIGWVRRTRVGGQWRDGGDVALSEASERYEVDILDGSDVVRTVAGITPSIYYSAAQQITDFGSAQASIDLRIYQLSDMAGRGYPLVVLL